MAHTLLPGETKEFLLVENIAIPGWKGHRNFIAHPSTHVGIHMPTELAAKHAIEHHITENNDPKDGFGARVLGRPLRRSDFLIRRVQVRASVIDTKTYE